MSARRRRQESVLVEPIRAYQQLVLGDGAHRVVKRSPVQIGELLARLDARLLGPDGHLQLLPAAAFDGLDPDDLTVWCMFRGYWLLPTWELVAFLREVIRDRRAIEVGAGQGVLGRALQIPRTDLHLHESVPGRLHAGLLGQPVVLLPDDVERCEATEAVIAHRPQVVVSSWTVQRARPGEAVPLLRHSSDWGVEDLAIYRHVETYVLVGAEPTHSAHRRILRDVRPSRVEAPAWLRSRAADQRTNRIWIWHNPAPVRPVRAGSPAEFVGREG